MNIINLRAEYMTFVQSTDWQSEYGIPNNCDLGCEDYITVFVDQRFASKKAREDAKTFLLAEFNDRWDEVEIVPEKVTRNVTVKTAVVDCKITGIYEWGEGWSQETSRKWHFILDHLKTIHWKYFKDDHGTLGSDYLVSLQGCIYLHPEGFRTVLHSTGGCSPKGNDDVLEDYFGSYLDELKEILTLLTEATGGEFTLVASAKELDVVAREW